MFVLHHQKFEYLNSNMIILKYYKRMDTVQNRKYLNSNMIILKFLYEPKTI